MAYHLLAQEVHGFGQRLRAWRDGNKFDLGAAARLLGVSDNYLYMIERGVHAPSVPLLAKFEELVCGLSFFTAPEITRRIPIVSWVQAGRFTHYEELPLSWEEWIDTLCPDPNAFAVRVVGDSMLPKYPAGNLAICMPSFPPKNNGLAVAKIHDESVTFKTVSFRGKQPDHFRLVALNPKYGSMFVKREDLVWIYPVHAVVSPCHGQRD